MKTKAIFAAALVGVLAFSGIASAQDIATESIAFHVGMYLPTISTQLSVNPAGGTGSTVNLEQDLGLSDRTSSPILDINWRFAQHHRLEFMYFELLRTSTKVIDREIILGGQTYPINTTVTSKMRNQIGALTYYYSLMQSSKYEFALGLGVHNTIFKPSLSSSAGTIATSKRLDVPLPVLAIKGNMQLGEKWTGAASGKWFGMQLGDIYGGLTVLNIGATYFMTKNWGIEAAYSSNRYKFDITRPDWNGNLNITYSGPQLSLVGLF